MMPDYIFELGFALGVILLASVLGVWLLILLSPILVWFI